MILGCQHCQHALFFRVLPGMTQTDLDIVQLAWCCMEQQICQDFTLPLMFPDGLAQDSSDV